MHSTALAPVAKRQTLTRATSTPSRGDAIFFWFLVMMMMRRRTVNCEREMRCEIHRRRPSKAAASDIVAIPCSGDASVTTSATASDNRLLQTAGGASDGDGGGRPNYLSLSLSPTNRILSAAATANQTITHSLTGGQTRRASQGGPRRGRRQTPAPTRTATPPPRGPPRPSPGPRSRRTGRPGACRCWCCRWFWCWC